MRFAARQGAIVVNPVREVAQIEGTPRRRPRALTGEERQAWLAALESSQKAQDWDLPDLTRFLLATGCRIGEALAVGMGRRGPGGGHCRDPFAPGAS